MSPTTAMLVLAWIAIGILYLGLAATLREVRALRAVLDRRPGQPAPSSRSITLGGLPPSASDQDRLVLVVDSGCPLCAACLDALPTTAARLKDLVIVLHEGSLTIEGEGVTAYSDPADLGEFAHLSPPVLVLAGPEGQVRDLALVTNPTDIDTVCASWGLVVHEDRSAHESQV